MAIRPILSTLRRHKTAALLIVVEMALTTAIVCNALHLIIERLAVLNNDTGLPEAELVVVSPRGGARIEAADDVSAQDLRALAQLPGVKGVALVNQVVYGNNSSNASVSHESGRQARSVTAAYYEGTRGLLHTLGLPLLAGRDFLPEEMVAETWVRKQETPRIGQVIINRALAQRLWPGLAPAQVVGKAVYGGSGRPTTVVGVVDHLPHPYPTRARNNQQGYAMLFPIEPSYRSGEYVLRVDPLQRDAVLRAAPGALEAVDNTRIVGQARATLDMRSRYYAQDRAMVWLMGGVCVAMLLVTALGVVGLASFWVQQRTRMIGVRRALGATATQILAYFQLENLLLSTVGIVLGLLAAYAINQGLMASYELPRLPWGYAPVAALLLWGLGQAAVWWPARRAAALPPALVMRGA